MNGLTKRLGLSPPTRRVVRPCPPSSASWHLAHHRLASSTAASPLAFPSKPNPTPWEIFHFSPSDTLTPSIVKNRFYELAKLYHPDSSPQTTTEFRAIVSAYELLRSPSRRSNYQSTVGTGTGYSAPGFDFTRGRPMRPQRGYAAPAWDWGDPYSPHFRPKSGGMGARGRERHHEGVYMNNTAFFLGLMAFSLLLAPLSAYSAWPKDVSAGGASLDGTSITEMPGNAISWNRHEDAARALAQARREARVEGTAKREALRRRVRQLEHRKATERAFEVDRIAREEKGTGHVLSLPPPPPSSSSPRL